MVIRRVGPVSAAKIAGVLYALIGLCMGALFSLVAVVGGMATPSGADGAAFPGPLAGAIFGAGSIILFPVLYGMFGFVGTLITALLYNAVAGVVGGVEIDVQ